MFARCALNGLIVSVDAPRLYVDTNGFIVAFETVGDASDAMKQLLGAAMAKRVRLLTSELTLAELLIVPVRNGNARLKRAYMQALIWSQAVELVPISREILIETTTYRANADQGGVDKPDRRNFLPDAIHVVTAVTNACAVFIGNDKRLRLPAGIEKITPAAATLESLLNQT